MKKLVTLLLMALMVTGLHAQMKSELPNVTLKNLNGKDVNIAKLNNNGNPIPSGLPGAVPALRNTMPSTMSIKTGRMRRV